MSAFRGGLNPSARLDDDLAPIQAADAGGVFCRETLDLQAGPHTVRLQVMLAQRVTRQCVELTATTLAGTVLAHATLDSSEPDALARADDISLSFVLTEPATVVIEGVASTHARLTHLRFVTHVPVPMFQGHEALFRFHPDFDLTDMVPQSVIFGTTAVCNANCFHCPTNKAYSKTQAKGFMDMALFERIVDELAEMGFSGGVVFGLFGDPLSDPLFLERMRIVRRRLPGVVICPSTNAAQYDTDRHGEALSYADDVAIHIEGVTPQVYEASMRPLKLARTAPRAERLIEDRAGKPVHVISPVHRRNLHEMAPLRDLWEGRGAGPTFFSYLMNRGGQAEAFDDVALAPTATGCGLEIVRDLVIDWDGKVLTCCQDFHRRTIIGDLATESVREVLTNAGRRRAADIFNNKRWNTIETCASCKNDCETSVTALVAERLKDSDARRTFTPREFQAKGAAEADPAVFRVQTRRPLLDQLKTRFKGGPKAIIFGPYKPFYPGRYRLAFDIRVARIEPRASLIVEVAAPSGLLAVRRLRGLATRRPGPVEIDTPAYAPLEFRILAKGMDFEFRGVSSVRLSS